MLVVIVNSGRKIMLIVKNNNEGVNNYIKQYESANCVKIPDTFVSFLRKYNGGLTPKTTFVNDGISSDLRALYGFGNVPYSFNNIDPGNFTIDGVLHTLLPIGEDSYSNKFAISLSDKGVYFIDHEMNTKKQIVKVSDSLQQFFDACCSKEINPNSKKSPEEREKALRENGKDSVISDALRQLWSEEYLKYKDIVQEVVAID